MQLKFCNLLAVWSKFPSEPGGFGVIPPNPPGFSIRLSSYEILNTPTLFCSHRAGPTIDRPDVDHRAMLVHVHARVEIAGRTTVAGMNFGRISHFPMGCVPDDAMFLGTEKRDLDVRHVLDPGKAEFVTETLDAHI